MRLTALTLLACAAGCSAEKVESGDTANPETDADTDTDADADSDADTDTDPVETDLALWVDGDPTGLGWQLVHIDASAGFNPGEALVGGTVDGVDIPVDAPEPAASDLIEVEDFPGLYYAYYVPGLFLDADNDGEADPGEAWAGVGMTWALYLTGPKKLPADLSAMGLVLGWNAFDMNFDGHTGPVVADPMAIPVPDNLRAVEEITVGGMLMSGVGEARVALVPSTVFDGGTTSTYVYDEVLYGVWEATITGAPPEDHLISLDGAGMIAAAEAPVYYTDQNFSESLDAYDYVVDVACMDGSVVGAFWLAPTDDFYYAFNYALSGIGIGWDVVVFGGEELEYLPEEDWLSLNFTGECDLTMK